MTPDRELLEPVAEEFRYASDTNSEWLTVNQIRELLRREREKKT